MINVQNISSKLASLPDAALKQYAAMHKDDPYVFSLALSESNRRKEIRSQAQQPAPQPKVVDQELAEMDIRKELPENLGIARLPVDMNMASGGIVAFDDGGYVPRYKEKGLVDAKTVFMQQYGPVAEDVGKQIGVDPSILLAQWGMESRFGESTVGKFNVGNIKDPNGKGPKAFDKAEKSKSSYREYDSPEDFGQDYAKLIQRNFPKAIGVGADVDAFSSGLQNGRIGSYATDKDYGKTLAKTLTSLVPISSAQAEPSPAAAPVKESSWRDLLPSFGGDKVSDQKLSDLVTGGTKPAPQAGPSATLPGIGKALMTQEGAKRAGLGALDAFTVGTAGMPSDIARTMPTSPIPVVRALGSATDYLRSKFAPNANPEAGTTPYLKQKAVEAGLRTPESTDPNLRAIQTGGELAGYFVNPINFIRSGAGKIGNAIREGRTELQAMGLQDIADKKAAAAATAKAEADAAEKSANQLRLGMKQPSVAPTRPAAPGVAPSLTPQPAGFPVSEEALRLKQQQQAAAAARASQAPPPPTSAGPSLGAKVELDKMEAARKARLAAGLEKDAATAKAMADAKRAEAINVPSKTTGGKPVIASPSQVLARQTGKESFPSVSMSDGSEEDMARETQSLSNRYPAPPEPDKPINYDQGVGRRDAGYGTDKQIVKAAKEALPKSEDTDGWSKNDWLQFGLAMMAGQSPHALSNIGQAGLSVLAAKQAKQLEKDKLENYKLIYGGKQEREVAIKQLMDEDPSLSYSKALAKYTELIEPPSRMAGVDTRGEKIDSDKLKAFQDAKTKLYGDFKMYMTGTGTAAKAQQAEYKKQLQELHKAFNIPMEDTATASSASGWGLPTKQ